MNTSTLRWTLVASALTIGLAACTVTTDDTDTDGGATGGTGGATGGTGGATGGTGGATGGTGGETGGTGGATGGTGGGTGGTGGSLDCTPTASDACTVCGYTNCCEEIYACGADTTCSAEWDCFINCTGDPTACGQQCDTEFNTQFNDLFNCMYVDTPNCAGDCG